MGQELYLGKNKRGCAEKRPGITFNPNLVSHYQYRQPSRVCTEDKILSNAGSKKRRLALNGANGEWTGDDDRNPVRALCATPGCTGSGTIISDDGLICWACHDHREELLRAAFPLPEIVDDPVDNFWFDQEEDVPVNHVCHACMVVRLCTNTNDCTCFDIEFHGTTFQACSPQCAYNLHMIMSALNGSHGEFTESDDVDATMDKKSNSRPLCDGKARVFSSPEDAFKWVKASATEIDKIIRRNAAALGPDDPRSESRCSCFHCQTLGVQHTHALKKAGARRREAAIRLNSQSKQEPRPQSKRKLCLKKDCNCKHMHTFEQQSVLDAIVHHICARHNCELDLGKVDGEDGAIADVDDIDDVDFDPSALGDDSEETVDDLDLDDLDFDEQIEQRNREVDAQYELRAATLIEMATYMPRQAHHSSALRTIPKLPFNYTIEPLPLCRSDDAPCHHTPPSRPPTPKEKKKIKTAAPFGPMPFPPRAGSTTRATAPLADNESDSGSDSDPEVNFWADQVHPYDKITEDRLTASRGRFSALEDFEAPDEGDEADVESTPSPTTTSHKSKSTATVMPFTKVIKEAQAANRKLKQKQYALTGGEEEEKKNWSTDQHGVSTAPEAQDDKDAAFEVVTLAPELVATLATAIQTIEKNIASTEKKHNPSMTREEYDRIKAHNVHNILDPGDRMTFDKIDRESLMTMEEYRAWEAEGFKVGMPLKKDGGYTHRTRPEPSAPSATPSESDEDTEENETSVISTSSDDASSDSTSVASVSEEEVVEGWEMGYNINGVDWDYRANEKNPDSDSDIEDYAPAANRPIRTGFVRRIVDRINRLGRKKAAAEPVPGLQPEDPPEPQPEPAPIVPLTKSQILAAARSSHCLWSMARRETLSPEMLKLVLALEKHQGPGLYGVDGDFTGLRLPAIRDFETQSRALFSTVQPLRNNSSGYFWGTVANIDHADPSANSLTNRSLHDYVLDWLQGTFKTRSKALDAACELEQRNFDFFMEVAQSEAFAGVNLDGSVRKRGVEKETRLECFLTELGFKSLFAAEIYPKLLLELEVRDISQRPALGTDGQTRGYMAGTVDQQQQLIDNNYWGVYGDVDKVHNTTTYFYQQLVFKSKRTINTTVQPAPGAANPKAINAGTSAQSSNPSGGRSRG